ncbi:MAG: hypothetical protein GY854_04440 [Deltaproteobacteria bacterium]|nr:hypothetical protein [Deltaproteobacteria bacterium]
MKKSTEGTDLKQALSILDGDRAAEPLITLHTERREIREESTTALGEIEQQLEELKSEIKRLDLSLDQIEEKIIELADQRQNQPKESFKFMRDEFGKDFDTADLRHKIIERAAEAMNKTRSAASAVPRPPIPEERLRPDFAATAMSGAKNDLSGIIPGFGSADGAGKVNAQALKAMLTEIGKSGMSGLTADSENMDTSVAEDAIQKLGQAITGGKEIDKGAIKAFLDQYNEGHKSLLSGDEQTIKEIRGSLINMFGGEENVQSFRDEVLANIERGGLESSPDTTLADAFRTGVAPEDQSGDDATAESPETTEA